MIFSPFILHALHQGRDPGRYSGLETGDPRPGGRPEAALQIFIQAPYALFHTCHGVGYLFHVFRHLTDEQQQFRDVLRKFCEERIAPRAAETDEKEEYDWESFKAICEMELPALGVPEAYGGSGADLVTQAIAAEEQVPLPGAPAAK
jgi:hypothetical protein